jgi:cobalt-precorrin-6B (C15)-methyltransferase
MDVYPPGIPDEAFFRGSVPMTKSEVRAITMSKARLRDGMRVLDLGAGTGSFTVEAGLLCPHGTVVALERDLEALAVLAENLRRFEVSNVTVVAGSAPDALAELGRFDRVLLGGTGGQMAAILAALPGVLVPGGWVVSNTIGLESTVDVLNGLRAAPWTETEIVQVTISRGAPLGNLTRMEPLNPIWVVSARLGA